MKLSKPKEYIMLLIDDIEKILKNAVENRLRGFNSNRYSISDICEQYNKELTKVVHLEDEIAEILTCLEENYEP